MDPKMDSGLMPPITDEMFNVFDPRSPQEIIGIMDQLFSYEVGAACLVTLISLISGA